MIKLRSEWTIKVLFIGDIVGSTGRKALKQMLPYYREKYLPDFVIVNGENAAGGRGITQKIANEFYQWGVDGITMGNHTWGNDDIFQFIDDDPSIVRPANFPAGSPGRGYTIIESGKKQLAIVNLQGRTFMPAIDCPFVKADEIIEQIKAPQRCILVDFHAEATSEKVAMGWHLDGKVAAMVGTHTHVQTNDECILPQGTAYVTDVGMVGSREGVLGVDRRIILNRFIMQMPERFTPSAGKWFFHGVLLELDELTGKAKHIELIRRDEDEFILE